MKIIKLLFVFLSLIILSSYAFCGEQVIRVKTGNNFKIELKSNPTTGYQWQLAKPLNKKIVDLVSSDYIPPKTNLVGAGNKEIWVFKAVKKGKTEILLKYARPWESVQPIEQKTYIIEVQ